VLYDNRPNIKVYGCFTLPVHMSQYLSIRVMPPFTLNKASWVATLPQCAQNFGLPLCSVNGLNDVNFFSI